MSHNGGLLHLNDFSGGLCACARACDNKTGTRERARKFCAQVSKYFCASVCVCVCVCVCVEKCANACLELALTPEAHSNAFTFGT